MTHLETITADITELDHDVIVNAANSALAGGGGVDGAIHRAGGPSILEECQQWVNAHGRLATGSAMVTGAGNLPSKHIVHTVGPVWEAHGSDEAQSLLADCYRNSLELVQQLGASSVAFPCISTGVFGFPKRLAGEVAVSTTQRWVAQNPGLALVTFVCFGDENLDIYSELLGS